MNERELIERLSDYLKETHEEAMYQEHGGSHGMRKHRKEEPDCTYCKAIADAETLLQAI